MRAVKETLIGGLMAVGRSNERTYCFAAYSIIEDAGSSERYDNCRLNVGRLSSPMGFSEARRKPLRKGYEVETR